MKRLLLGLLTLCVLLCGCTAPLASQEPEPAPDYSGYERADDPLTPEKIAAIPIAHDGMTAQELRQICLDYMKLSVSCQWVADGTFCIEEEDKDNVEKNFTEGKLYGGIPYINMASGNLYRFMEYCDPETGILDSTGLLADPDLFSTACSGTAGWAWERVINSAEISWTHSINVKHGFVPVGPYKYDFDMDVLWEWGEDGKKIYYYDTKKICKQNGEQTMFESYAQTHLADCYSRTGHVAMAASEPVVVRDENGNIDGEKSYIDIAEQGQYTKAKYHIRHTSDGTEYRIRGNDGRPFTFQALYEAGYLVHTFEEFLGTDPVEEGMATIEHSGATVTANQLSKGDITANYPISDIFTTVYDKNGKVLYEHVERTKEHFIKVVPAKEYIPFGDLANYRFSGKNRVLITAQLSTGGIVTVYDGTLKPF